MRDPLGSAALTVDASPESNVVQVVSHEPWGGVRRDDTFDNDPTDGHIPLRDDYLFNGKEREAYYDLDEDVYDFGARLYLANVGRWMSPDPLLKDGLNRYAFVRNNRPRRWF